MTTLESFMRSEVVSFQTSKPSPSGRDWRRGWSASSPLALKMTDVRVSALVARLSAMTGIPISASTAVAETRVTIHLETTTLREALGRIAENARCSVAVDDEGVRLAR